MNLLGDVNDLLQTIKKAALESFDATKPTTVVFGKVISVAPLKINVEQKMILTDAQLVLTQSVMDFKTQMSFDNPMVKQVYTTLNMNETTESSPAKIIFKQKIKHDITIYNHLLVGDEVLLLRVQGGQKYIVLDRVMKQ